MCNCNKPKGFNSSVRAVQPANNTPRVINAQNKDNFCTKCGWVLKRRKYIDVRANKMVDDIVCTNTNCPSNK